MPHLSSHRPHLPALASSVLAASLWLLPGAGLAFAVRDVPNPRQSHGGWVADMAGILGMDTETSINGMIDALGRQDGSEMMVVTVPDTSGSSSPKTFATELFNTLKIGKKGLDNGVLMLISKGDRRVEIETGYGMEERLPDARVGSIISSAMLPRFKQGDFDGGTLVGVEEVIGTLSPEARKNVDIADNTSTPFPAPIYFYIFVALLAPALAWSLVALVYTVTKHGYTSIGGGESSSFSGSDSGSGGGSSGGGSSGGGSSGGGGAGGSW